MPYGRARQALRKPTSVADEIAMKNARAYGHVGGDAFRAGAMWRTTISAWWSQAASAPTCVRCRTASWSTATTSAISRNCPPPEIPRAEVDRRTLRGRDVHGTAAAAFRRMGPGDAGNLPRDSGVGEKRGRGGVEVADLTQRLDAPAASFRLAVRAGSGEGSRSLVESTPCPTHRRFDIAELRFGGTMTARRRYASPHGQTVKT